VRPALFAKVNWAWAKHVLDFSLFDDDLAAIGDEPCSVFHAICQAARL